MKRTDETKYQSFAHRIDVERVIDELGFETQRTGNNKAGEPEYIGQCLDPWGLHKHGDTTGKLAINPEKCVWNCFVCGGGRLLDLTMAVRDCTDEAAEAWLYEFTTPGDKTAEDFLSEIDAILYQEQVENPPLPYYNDHVLDRWTAAVGEPWHRWLSSRGISDETAQMARVGFQGDALRMKARGDSTTYTGPCIYLPHWWGARLVGWQQRWIEPDRPKWLPKYTNTSGFPKTETLHGYEDVYLADRPIIVVESVPTRLFLKSLGYPAIATFGSTLSEEQMRLLRLCQQGVVLAPDNDAPGWKWLGYSEEEKRRGSLDRVVLANNLARFVPLKVIEPVGMYGSGNDLNDLVDEGLPFARQAVNILYNDAEWFQ